MGKVEYFFGLYSFGLFLIYILLFICSLYAILKYITLRSIKSDFKVRQSNHVPGISIIAPAYNESVTIIQNVQSLLALFYSRFEIIIVDDGSTDDSLEKLIKEFDLVEIEDYIIQYKIECRPIRKIYKSKSMAFRKLTVIHKENGGCKADAVNAGLNVAVFPYVLNTDVDSILDSNAMEYLIKPILSSRKRVIAVGATLRMSNSCIIDSGKIEKINLPSNYLVRFQEIEYVRSYLFGKMGWSVFNAIPNVSGGLGLFEKKILIDVGGYDRNSLGEDMELLIRMYKYCIDEKIDYSVKYIPETLCWTEGPDSIKVFLRQRVRWARGLFQIVKTYKSILFNYKYKQLGLLVMPVNFLFEFLAPVVELLGVISIIFLLVSGLPSWEMIFLVLMMVYTFSVFLTTYCIILDHIISKYYDSWLEVAKLCVITMFEAFFYHPLIVFSGLKGIYQELIGKKHVWGAMPRSGGLKKK